MTISRFSFEIELDLPGGEFLVTGDVAQQLLYTFLEEPQFSNDTCEWLEDLVIQRFDESKNDWVDLTIQEQFVWVCRYWSDVLKDAKDEWQAWYEDYEENKLSR